MITHDIVTNHCPRIPTQLLAIRKEGKTDLLWTHRAPRVTRGYTFSGHDLYSKYREGLRIPRAHVQITV